MIKKQISVFLLVAALVSNAFAGLPPTSVQGQSDTAPQTKFNFQVPYSQKTDLGGVKALFETGNQNVLANASFENTSYSASWTISKTSGTTFTGAVDTTNFEDGKQSAALTATAALGCISQDVSVHPDFTGVNLEYGAWVKVPTAMASAIVQMSARQNGAAIGTPVTAPSTGNWVYVPVNYPGVANGTSVGVQVCSTVSATGSFNVDQMYVGQARNLSQVSQAQDYGTLTFPKTASCNWTITQATYASDFSANASCPTAIVTGLLTSPSKTPQASVVSAPVGTYVITWQSALGSGSPSNDSCRIVDDLGNQVGEQGALNINSINVPMTIVGKWSYAAAGTRTWKVQCLASTNNIVLQNASFSDASFHVEYYPSQSQIAVNSNTVPVTATYYMSTNQTPGINTAWNFDTKVTDTAGAVTTGAGTWKFTTPAFAPGNYLVNLTPVAASGGQVFIYKNGTVYAYVASTANATTIASSSLVIPLAANDFIDIRSSSNLTLDGDPLSQIVTTVSITNVTQNIPGPILVGSVTSGTSGLERIERASFSTACTSGPCTPNSQSGSWIPSGGLARSSAGAYTLTITAGEFSGTPSCTFSGEDSYVVTTQQSGNTSTSIGLNGRAGGTLADERFSIICMGPR